MNFFSTLKFRVLLSYVLLVLFALTVTAFFVDRSIESRALQGLRQTVALSFALSALFSLAAGWLVASLVARQFGEIVAGSKRFAGGDFGYRIPVGSSGELKKLSETLNFMAGEISVKMREAELRRLELEATFRDMSEAIVVSDGSGIITRMNPRARQLMGVRGFEAEGMRLSAMPAGPELSSAAIKALSSGHPVSFEIEPAAAPGTVLAVSASPIIEEGAVRGCVLVARDVTGPRRLEAMRRDFVANVSHELKTPLTAIRGCAETLLGGALEDKEHGPGFARSIFEQAVRLDNLVDDLLKISYAESGRVALEKTAVDLKALTDETARGLAAILAKKKVSVVNLVAAGLTAGADRDKLAQVLINLLDNAAKYNKEGGEIKISAAAENGGMKISVADTGSGIPAAHLPRIFERFYRVDKARSRELGGTGLGLSIVKHIVELHGGSVGVESSEGRGSTFWFTLPA
ncbi:MAG TPA: ATP-binding protein [Elusimicrobiales bacterium]|nr:ATP-binding protein [Elusimicrobiales bacterium]